MAMRIEIKNHLGFELEDFTTLCSLPHINRELTALLYGCSEKRNEVIYALRHPNDFVNSLERILNISHQMFDRIKQLAQLRKIHHNIHTVEITSINDANTHVFHNFSCEEINMISLCYLLSNGEDVKVFNPQLTIPHSINVLVTMQLDLTVTIIRFKEYLREFPSADLRKEHIVQNFINMDYD